MTPWRTLLWAPPSSKQSHVGMRMHVDEPRRDDEPARVDHPPGGRLWPQRPDDDDPVAANRDVAQEPGIAGAVDDPSAANQTGRRADRAVRRSEQLSQASGRDQQPADLSLAYSSDLASWSPIESEVWSSNAISSFYPRPRSPPGAAPSDHIHQQDVKVVA